MVVMSSPYPETMFHSGFGDRGKGIEFRTLGFFKECGISAVKLRDSWTGAITICD
jgi:hypothetical protein